MNVEKLQLDKIYDNNKCIKSIKNGCKNKQLYKTPILLLIKIILNTYNLIIESKFTTGNIIEEIESYYY